jgi:hypothetical protein
MIGIDNTVMVSEEDIMSSVDFATKLAAAMGSNAASVRLSAQLNLAEKGAKMFKSGIFMAPYIPSILQRRRGIRGRARTLKWRRT